MRYLNSHVHLLGHKCLDWWSVWKLDVYNLLFEESRGKKSDKSKMIFLVILMSCNDQASVVMDGFTEQQQVQSYFSI